MRFCGEDWVRFHHFYPPCHVGPTRDEDRQTWDKHNVDTMDIFATVYRRSDTRESSVINMYNIFNKHRNA